MGKEGLLSGRECSSAPGPGQRPLLAVGLPAGYLRPAEAVGLSGPPGRPGTPARLVRPHLLTVTSQPDTGDMIRVFQVPGPGAEEDGGSVDGLHVRSGAAGPAASARPGGKTFILSFPSLAQNITGVILPVPSVTAGMVWNNRVLFRVHMCSINMLTELATKDSYSGQFSAAIRKHFSC